MEVDDAAAAAIAATAAKSADVEDGMILFFCFIFVIPLLYIICIMKEVCIKKILIFNIKSLYHSVSKLNTLYAYF